MGIVIPIVMLIRKSSFVNTAKIVSQRFFWYNIYIAGVAELVDAQDLKFCEGNFVWVRLPPSALKSLIEYFEFSDFCVLLNSLFKPRTPVRLWRK